MFDKIVKGDAAIAIVGLGYVGLPLAVAFAKAGLRVIGFDSNSKKIAGYKAGHDATSEVGDQVLKASNVEFTNNPQALKDAAIIIIAVPTPVLDDNMPDLSILREASLLVGENMSKGCIVVYESTVYPGVTEDFCLPLLEKASNLKGGSDFKVGYSPERINPGDKKHRLETIVKITAGQDEESAEVITRLYGKVVKAGIHQAPSIRVAEASKVIENAQRDINIAFVNELALIFDRLEIDTKDVLEAACTKWNFLNFQPGLVGGHCIGVDPYYLSHLAETKGYHAQVVLAGRRINDGMGKFIAEKAVKRYLRSGGHARGAKVLILGLTFKENCPDIRNTKVMDIIKELKEYHMDVMVSDPIADPLDATQEYGLTLTPLKDCKDADIVILCVAHDEYKELSLAQLQGFYKPDRKLKPVLIDVKGIREDRDAFDYWRL